MTTLDKNKIAFRKMKSKGMYVPPLTVYDGARKLLKDHYFNILLDIIKLTKETAKYHNVTINRNGQVNDSVFSLVVALKNKLFDIDPDLVSIQLKLRGLLNKTQKSFFKQFYKDSDEKLDIFLTTMSLKKDDVFHGRINDLRELYVNNALERIKGEVDELKKQFLEELTDWIEGRSEKMNVDVLMKGMRTTAVNESKFFARDQFLKFNKSLLIASLKQAGVKRVEWVTMDDLAVRGNPSGPYAKSKSNHYILDGKIFDIDNIPKEFWEYNCRCGLKPIWD